MNGKLIKATAAMILCALMLGNLPVARASSIGGESVDAVLVMNSDWVATTQTRTNDMIYLTGNLTVPAGVTLTLVNTTIVMNCSVPGEFYINVLGNLVMQHGGLYTPMNALDYDASRITANNTAFRPYFWVKPGATFTATDSIIEYVGVDGRNGNVTGGNLPEADFTEWQAITNGSFRISIDGNVRDVSNLDFSSVTSMDDVATVVMVALQAFNFDGYTVAQVTWTGTQFVITAGTLNTVDGFTTMKSTVAILGTHSTGAGTDISGMKNRSAANTWWLDCALNATANNFYSKYLGPYMESSSVSISNCLIQNNENGLIFDSVYPATLQNNNISFNDQIGLLVSNITNPNFALPAITLSNNNVIGSSDHGVAIQASTIGIEAFNMNVSENGYGMNFYSKGNMNANVHDCVIWRNNGATHNHATALLMWTGPTGTLTGTVEHNNITENSCGGLWAGYQFGGTASYDTTLTIRNNTFVGNDGKETFQAINNLNVKVFDNFFGGSAYQGEADGMRIGFRHGDNYDFAPADTYVKNLVLVVANNIFDYGNVSDNWEVGGVLLTAARINMDATVTGNTLWGGSTSMGGIFKIGWPHPFEVCEGDPRFKRVDTLKAVVTNNNLSFRGKPYAGGVINFYAEDMTDIVCSDNTIYTEGGQMGGLIGVNHGAGWAGDYTVPCREVKAVIERNHITENISTDGNYFGGMIRVLGSYRITTTIRDNVLHRIHSGLNTVNQGNSGQQGSPWVWIGHPDSDAEESNSKAVYIDATVVGNKLTLDLNVTTSAGYTWNVGALIRAWAIMEVKANISDNDIQIRHTFTSNSNTIDLGSAIRLHAFGTVDTQIINNKILIANKYYGTGTGSSSLGGIIKVGSMDPTPQFVTGKIVGNNISFFDNSTSESTVGSVIRINAQTRADMEITDNNIMIRSYKSGADIDIGEVFRIWKCVDLDSDFSVPIEVEMDLHRNTVKIYNNATSSGDGGGGIMRLHGLTSTVLRMTNNIFQFTYTNPLFTNSSAYDMGVRVGYHCYDDGILSSNVDVTSSNNIIGPGGVGGGFIIAGSSVKVDMNGDTIQKARYNDCGDMGYYTTEYTYGNGLVLLGNQIDANIRNVNLINNEGAGLYVDAAGDANIFLDNCNIRNNSWHGVYVKSQTAMNNMGRINNTRVQWNGNDTDGNFGDLGSGAYAVNSTITFSNCTFNNPNGSVEFNSTDVSYITALNTVFTNQSRVSVDTQSIFLRQWFMNLKVQQQLSGAGIPYAGVVVNDLQGGNAYTSQVGQDGYWRWMPMSQYMQNATATTTLTAHAITATKGTETAYANPVMTTNRDVVIALNYVSLPPVANASLDQTVNESAIVAFDATGSTDDYYIINYTWNCTTLGLTLYGTNPTFNVTNRAGVHNVTLTVQDVEGYSDSDFVLITVLDSTSPIANAGPDQIVNEDALVTFSGAGSSDNQGIANYTWTCGTTTLYGVNPAHIFDQPGIYNFTLRVADAAGHNATDNTLITVLDITDPTVNAGAPQTVAEGTLVTLTGVACTDNVGIVAYMWSFNDGSNDIVRYGQSLTYTFRNRGNFTVTLNCTDAAGNVGTGTTYVVVEDQTAPVVLVVAPGESLTGVPVDWELVIVFDEPMNTASVEAALTITGGIEVIGFTWDASGRYATVQFGEMAYGTEYTISIATSATDASGNPLAAAYTASFTTLSEPEQPEVEADFMADNWWILVVVIVVLVVLLLVQMLRGGKSTPAAAPASEEAPTPEPETAPDPEASPEEEEIQ